MKFMCNLFVLMVRKRHGMDEGERDRTHGCEIRKKAHKRTWRSVFLSTGAKKNQKNSHSYSGSKNESENGGYYFGHSDTAHIVERSTSSREPMWRVTAMSYQCMFFAILYRLCEP